MAGRTTSLGLWGLDIADGRLRLVHVGRVARRPQLTHAVTVPIPPDAGEEELGDLLRRAVDASGVAAEQVAICLPTTAGYVRCEDEADDAAEAANDDVFAGGAWTVDAGDHTLTVTGMADRREAEKLIRVVMRAGLKVTHVALPQVAAAAALGMLNGSDDKGAEAGFVIDRAHVRFTLARGGALLVTRSTPRAGRGASPAPLLQTATAILRAAQLTAPGDLPPDLTVIAGDDDIAAIEPMASTVGVTLHRAQPGQAVGLTIDRHASDEAGEYSAPIGAALLGAGLTDRKMNLLGALTHRDTPRPRNRRRFWAATAGLIVVAAIAVFAATWIPKRLELARLEREYEARRPLLVRREQARQAWRQLRPWLSTRQDGERIEHLEILKRITELFPEPADAYVSDMTVDLPRGDGPVSINLTGRAVSSDILHACVARLNESGIFTTRPVRLSDVEHAPSYPKRYVIPIAMEGPGDER